MHRSPSQFAASLMPNMAFLVTATTQTSVSPRERMYAMPMRFKACHKGERVSGLTKYAEHASSFLHNRVWFGRLDPKRGLWKSSGTCFKLQSVALPMSQGFDEAKYSFHNDSSVVRVMDAAPFRSQRQAISRRNLNLRETLGSQDARRSASQPRLDTNFPRALCLWLFDLGSRTPAEMPSPF